MKTDKTAIELTPYKKTVPSSPINVRCLYTVHYFRYGQKFAFKGERHDFWELVYIDSGAAEITAGDKTLVLTQGECYFHKPGEYHNIRTDEQFANSVIVSFGCDSAAMSVLEDARLTLGEAEKPLLNKIVRESSDAFTDKLNDVYLNKMHRSPDAPFGGEQLIKLYVEQLLILLCRRRFAADGKTESGGEPKERQAKNAGELVERIKAYLAENTYGTITIDGVANAMFFSKTYVKSVFKKGTGQTIMQYFSSLKIDEAKKLISYNRYTFTEIAYRLGYSSLHYFSRQFKKSTEMTLSEYARSIKVDDVL